MCLVSTACIPVLQTSLDFHKKLGQKRNNIVTKREFLESVMQPDRPDENFQFIQNKSATSIKAKSH